MTKENILEKIKEDGHRLTRVRKAMIGIFSDKKCVLDSSEIIIKLSKLHIKADRTTVYRELCFLLEKNVIRKVQLSDNKTYYEIASGHHHHLVCTKCNDVKEIVLSQHLEEQEKKIYRKETFKVCSHSLEFYGLCSNCL
jgi:Fur family ferric uptake transcriptional regulator